MRIWPSVHIFTRGTSGVSSTVNLLRTLTGLTAYEHSITAVGGFESCRVTFAGTLHEAIFWLDQLMSNVIVTGPEAETVWEGFVSAVDIQIGSLTQSRSLDGMASRVKTRYTTATGVPGVTSAASDTASIALYGTHDTVLSVGGTTATLAASLRDTYVSEHKNPRFAGGSTSATGNDGSESSITLTMVGWMTTLDWVVTSRTDTSTEATTTQITDLLAASGVGIGVTNNFLGGVTITTASGVNDTRFIAPDTTYRAKIESLLSKGTSSNQRMVGGVYEDRKFVAAVWAGAAPSTIGYWVSARTRAIYDGAYGTVPPWNVRPNAMAGLMELLDVAPVETAQDAAARFFVERVTCAVSGSGWSVALEPSEQTGFDARLARIG